MRYSEINEYRTGGDKNPKETEEVIIKQLLKVASSSIANTYISYTAIGKLGINPNSVYNTPVGIYCYPLGNSDGLTEVLMNIKDSGLTGVPYMGDSPNIYFFKAKNSGKGLIIRDYNEGNFQTDIEKLSNFLINKYPVMNEKVVKEIINDAKEESLDRTSAGYIWNITRHAALMIAGNKTIPPGLGEQTVNEYSPSTENAKKSATVWTALLRKILGYEYIDDSDGQGIIHRNEKTQAVFFNKAFVRVIKRYDNPSSSQLPKLKAHNSGKSNQPPDWNKIKKLFSQEKANGWLNLYKFAHKNNKKKPFLPFASVELEVGKQFNQPGTMTLDPDTAAKVAERWAEQLTGKYGIKIIGSNQLNPPPAQIDIETEQNDSPKP